MAVDSSRLCRTSAHSDLLRWNIWKVRSVCKAQLLFRPSVVSSAPRNVSALPADPLWLSL